MLRLLAIGSERCFISVAVRSRDRGGAGRVSDDVFSLLVHSNPEHHSVDAFAGCYQIDL